MAEKHFYEQEKYTREYLVDHLKKHIPMSNTTDFNILEVGCAEGGSIAVFDQEGYNVAGIELEPYRVKIASEKIPHIDVQQHDITDPKSLEGRPKYDLIIIRDVIEHIPDKATTFKHLHELLKPQGFVFITFPLKYSPYAGHQQTAKSFLKFIPFITLLPKFMIRFLAKLAKDERQKDEILYLKDHALSYVKLKRLIRDTFSIHHVDFFLSRPIFKFRFGWKIIKIPKIPIFREIAPGCEAILKRK